MLNICFSVWLLLVLRHANQAARISACRGLRRGVSVVSEPPTPERGSQLWFLLNNFCGGALVGEHVSAHGLYMSSRAINDARSSLLENCFSWPVWSHCSRAQVMKNFAYLCRRAERGNWVPAYVRKRTGHCIHVSGKIRATELGSYKRNNCLLTGQLATKWLSSTHSWRRVSWSPQSCIQRHFADLIT